MFKKLSKPTLFERAQEFLIARAAKQGARNSQGAADLWAKGFLPGTCELYDFNTHPVEEYLSDLQREMTRGINGPYAALLHSKILFNEIFGAIVSTPLIVAYTNSNALIGELSSGLRFFAKPVEGGGGLGVIRGEVNASGIAIKTEVFSRDAFERALLELSAQRKHYWENGYIVTEAVVPHKTISGFFPGTVNTVRILMMRDEQGVFVATAVLRVGCSTSGFVDNFSSGGLSYAIDAFTGQIGPGRRKNGRHVTEHPETGAPITGENLPMWDLTLESARRAMEHCSGLRYVGWDIVISPDGPVFLEGNHYSDVDLFQVHGPLLKNERVRAFYAANGILSYQPSTPLD